MSLATKPWSSTWSPVISTPAVTPAPLLRLRDESRWNTCGYVSGDIDDPHTLCDDCVCESNSGIMVECSGSGDDRTCDPATTLCYPSTYASGAIAESGDLFCTEPASPECQVMLWTDIDVYSIVGCAPQEIVISLSFSHPEPTTIAAASDQTTSSSSSKARTPTAAPVATSTPTPKRKYFTAAETAGMIIGLVVGVAFLTGAFFQFFRKRREAAVAGKNHAAAIEKRHSGGPPAVAAVGPGTAEEPNNVDGPPQPTPDRQGDNQPTQAPGLGTAVHQPMAPSTANSTMASPNLSPMPSRSISPIPNVGSLSPQPSHPHLSAVSSQFSVEADRASYVPMPPYPGTPPIDRRFSPSPVTTIRSFSNPSQIRIAPAQSSGNTVNGDIAYTSIYGGYSSAAPSTPVSHMSQGRQPIQMGEVPPVPKMTASWFQDRDSVVSEMDTAGAIAGPASTQGTKDNRMTIASELLGSVPGQPRRAI